MASEGENANEEDEYQEGEAEHAPGQEGRDQGPGCRDWSQGRPHLLQGRIEKARPPLRPRGIDDGTDRGPRREEWLPTVCLAATIQRAGPGARLAELDPKENRR